jgi:nucleotide-binding universal stress UspA family protein
MIMNQAPPKKILVPVDFSKTAYKAFHHVKFLANKFSSEVTLIHVEEDWPYAGTFPFLVEPQLQDQSKHGKHILEKLTELKAELEEDGIAKVQIEYMQGNIAECIASYAESEKMDLVVMGTHGARGLTGFLMGSNAYKVVNFIDTPVLTVNEQAAFGPYKNIIAPLDDTRYSRAKFPYIVEMAVALEANVEVVYPIVSDPEKKNKIQKYFEQVSALMEAKNVKHVSRGVEGHFAHEVVKLAEYTNADLVVIMSDSDTTISNMLMGTFAHEVVNHCKVPVLTLHHDQGGDLMDTFAPVR